MSENLADAFLNGESLKNAPGPYFGEYGRAVDARVADCRPWMELGRPTFNEAKEPTPSSLPIPSVFLLSIRTVRRC